MIYLAASLMVQQDAAAANDAEDFKPTQGTDMDQLRAMMASAIHETWMASAQPEAHGQRHSIHVSCIAPRYHAPPSTRAHI